MAPPAHETRIIDRFIQSRKAEDRYFTKETPRSFHFAVPQCKFSRLLPPVFGPKPELKENNCVAQRRWGAPDRSTVCSQLRRAPQPLQSPFSLPATWNVRLKAVIRIFRETSELRPGKLDGVSGSAKSPRRNLHGNVNRRTAARPRKLARQVPHLSRHD
jgi:hypothetical protein